VNDEPAFVLAAHRGEPRRTTLAAQVLRGSLGQQYSPLPIWFYQALLLATPNPIQVSVIKNVITIALMVTEAALPRAPALAVAVARAARVASRRGSSTGAARSGTTTC
jgi:hypothetical protein